MASASSPSSSTDDGNHINKCKLQFYKEISSYTNNSSNNPLFSVERYDQMVELIVNAKLKTPGNRSRHEITCLKAYDVIDYGGKLKLSKKNDEFSDGIIKYFIQVDELFGPKSLREIVRLQSINGGQGVMKCDCKGGCKTNRCKCKQAKVLCNSRCHHSGRYDNK